MTIPVEGQIISPDWLTWAAAPVSADWSVADLLLPADWSKPTDGGQLRTPDWWRRTATDQLEPFDWAGRM